MSTGVDVAAARVSLRNRAIVDVFDLALRFVVVHAVAFAKVSLFVLAPCLALSLAAASAWGWIAGWAVALVLGVMARIPFTVLASRLVFDDAVRVRSVLGSAAREIPRIAVMRGIWLLAVGTGLFFFIFPAFYVSAIFLFLDEIVVLERSGIGGAFVRAQRVASNGPGETFVATLLVIILPLVAVVLAEFGGQTLIGELLQFRPPASAWSTGGSVLCLLGWFGIVPYVATARFFTYLNIRTRTEGWDIQTRFAALAARTTPSPMTEAA